MKDISALTVKFTRDDINNIIDRVEGNSGTINEVVDSIVADYCKPLDDYMQVIDEILREGNEIADYELDDFALNLPSLIYFACSAQESLGVKEDVSKAIRSEVYNKVREKSQGTVADKDSVADLASQQETVVVIIYQRAYKKVKARIEAAYEMLNSVKKVMTRRIAQYGISDSDRN